MTNITGKVERIWLHMLDRTQHRLSFKKMCLLFFFLYAGLVMIAIVIIQQSKPDQHLIYTDNSGYHFDTRLYENIKSDNSTKDSQAQNIVEEKKCFHSGKIKEIKTPKFIEIVKDVYILNGFYDTRNSSDRRIQILAMGHVTQYDVTPIYCSLYNDDTASLHVNQVEWHPLHVQVPALYQAYMLTCGVADTFKTNPCKVYLSSNTTFGAREQVNVPLISLQPEGGRQGRYKRNVGVCLPPLHGVIPQARLVEMLEFNKLLGADSIFLYHYTGDFDNEQDSTNPNTQQVIDWYDKVDRAVTTYRWQLPVPAASTWNYAHKLAIQHCLYTNMWTHKYLLFVDPDEILIPQDGLSWTKMLQNLETEEDQHGNSTEDATDLPLAGYCFASVFFPPQFSHSLVSMASIDRDTTANYQRTKCMVRPEYVSDMGFFNVDKTIPSHMHTHLITTDTAKVHHYQHCDAESTSQSKCESFIEDKSALYHIEELLARYKHVQTQLSKTHMPEAVKL